MHGKKLRISKSKTKIFLAFVVVGIFIASGGLSAMASIYENANAVNPASSGSVSPSTSSSSSVAIGLVTSLEIPSLNYFSPVECYDFTTLLYMPFVAYCQPPHTYTGFVLGHYVTHNATYESWNLTLKKDLKWDNGSPLTSKDLWISLWLDNATGGITNVSSISIINTTTVDVILNSPQPNFLDEYATATNGIIVPYQTFYPLDKNYTKPLTKTFDSFSNEKNIVADGPYVITNYTAGTNPLVLTANKYFFEGSPSMSQITVRIFSSTSSMSAGLRSGEINTAWDYGPYKTVVDPLFSGIPNLKVYHLEIGGYMSAAFNMRQWPYNTTQFRQGLAYLTNRAALSSIVDEANAPLATYSGIISPLIESAAGINPSSISNYSYNVAKATTLLAEIGIDKDNAKGSVNYGLFVYNNSALPCYANPVTINITTAQFGYGDVSTATELESQWTAVGFKVGITDVSPSSFYPLIGCSVKGWDVAVAIDTGGGAPMAAEGIGTVFSSDNSTSTAPGYSADYKASFGVENYNFTELSRLFNESEKYKIYGTQSNKYVQEAANMIAQTVPFIPLFNEENTVISSTSLYWGNSTNHTGIFSTEALVQEEFWNGALFIVHPIISPTKVTSNFVYDYVIIGVVIAVVVIGGAAVGISTSRKHKKQKASDKEEDDMESKQ